jgi:hypothetical protein
MNFNLHSGLYGIALSAIATVVFAGAAVAQSPFPEFDPPELSRPDLGQSEAVEAPIVEQSQTKLIDTISSSSDLSEDKPTAAELRQARAQYRSLQRMERMERNLWAGYEPLRPNWNAIPMMSSRYPFRTTIQVPVYIYSR